MNLTFEILYALIYPIKIGRYIHILRKISAFNEL